jgi:hypothetical protein
MEDLRNLSEKANRYKSILQQTTDYRKAWHSELRNMIVDTLTDLNTKLDLHGNIETKEDLENLEVIVYSLGRTNSGIAEKVDNVLIRPLVRNNGALVYQQLFNGKVLIMIGYPVIEGLNEPKQPRTLEILRPEELKKAFISRHMETFLKDMADWEDFDDDIQTQQIGFNVGSPGFQSQQHNKR